MCDQTNRHWVAWVDGELDEDESRLLESHLDQCSECREQVRRIRVVSRDIGQYCRAADEHTPRLRRWWIPAAIAAAILLAAGLAGSLAWMRTGSAPPPLVARAIPEVQQPAPLRIAPPAPPAAVVRSRRPRVPQRPRAVKPPVVVSAAVDPRRFQGSPGILVVIPIDQVLPPGAAPPGAVLVGNLVFDAGGLPSSIQLQ